MGERVSRAFERAAEEERAAFIPYITAGDPSLGWTRSYLDALRDGGADIIELGVPFSDPVADGPVNQRAAERALASGTTLRGILDMVRGARAEGFKLPIVLFTYLNPLLRMGLGRFAEEAAKAGVDGVLAVDLPPEEAGEYRRALGAEGLDPVFLASPTTETDRLRLIGEASGGFVYYVSRLGVTGRKTETLDCIREDLERVRKEIRKPLAVGFGISEPEQARVLAAWADAVVVGSALVRRIEEASPEAAGAAIGQLAKEISGALKR